MRYLVFIGNILRVDYLKDCLAIFRDNSEFYEPFQAADEQAKRLTQAQALLCSRLVPLTILFRPNTSHAK